ncbi:Diacylglycerol kinase iota [Larimichthys crocea]|uniref:Diacylglycerol kinase iota n=1 Tax=Larimichthys crocea TaxID=215358 RepID=A0A6G0HQF4_LARCR|nr:Diacylglycerol kinase iota [Larimichthys crocea]
MGRLRQAWELELELGRDGDGGEEAAAGKGSEEGGGGGGGGEYRWEEWGGKQTLSQAINQRHSYCGTIIQSSLLHNSARGSSGLAVSFHPPLDWKVLCWHHAVGKHRRPSGLRTAAPRRRLHRGHRLHHGLAGGATGRRSRERLHQCREVILTTFKTVPVQVDGEPCRLAPSTLRISLRNQANMVQKSKRRTSVPLLNDPHAVPDRLRLRVNRISLQEYDRLQYDKERLRDISIPVGIVVVRGDCDLETCRLYIDRLQEDESRGVPRTSSSSRLSPNWSFLDSTSADRFYRIDKAQEHLHFVTEICQDEVFILDHEGPVVSQGASTGMPDLVVEPTGTPLTSEEQVLLTAASTGDLSMLSECVRRGVSLLVRDSGGCSALHIAQNGHADLVSYILQQGSKVLLDLTDREKGDTALHKGASEKQHAVCRLLVEAGASLEKTNFQGKTPADQAEGDPELASYLSNQQHTSSANREDLETAV